MDFGGSSAKGLGRGGRVGATRPCELSLYKTPPDESVSLDEFEVLAVERLRVLSGVEAAQSRGLKGADLASKLDTLMKSTHMRVNDLDDKRKDNISHWVLRLAFAANEDLRRRFLTFECLIFRHRFERQSRDEILEFIKVNDLGYKPISGAERDRWQDQLLDVFRTSGRFYELQKSGSLQDPTIVFQRTKYYKVPFTEVLDLVSKRRVFVRLGFAYVPHTDLVSILQSRFRAYLSQKLAVAYKSLPYVAQDERIAPLMKKMQLVSAGAEYGAKSKLGKVGAITPEMLGSLAGRSMPMCMRQLHHHMTKHHHLRYHGRVQFRLFLKGIGLSMEQCMAFFQSEFCKKPMSPEEFHKKYAYNIRHAYGKEGKRADYTPYSCIRIIMGPVPGADEAHGCPFKSYDERVCLKRLRLVMSKQGVGRADLDYICESVKTHDYQIACRKHFEVTHKGASLDSVGNHPNAWFDASVEHHNALKSAAKGGAASSTGAVAAVPAAAKASSLAAVSAAAKASSFVVGPPQAPKVAAVGQ